MFFMVLLWSYSLINKFTRLIEEKMKIYDLRIIGSINYLNKEIIMRIILKFGDLCRIWQMNLEFDFFKGELSTFYKCTQKK